MENRPLIERLARHLAADEPDAWPARVEDAASILAILKEPDAAMREAGDMAAWGAMIDAARRRVPSEWRGCWRRLDARGPRIGLVGGQVPRQPFDQGAVFHVGRTPISDARSPFAAIS